MILRFSLDKLLAGLTLTAGALVGLSLLIWLTVAHFIIGVMADDRADVSRGELAAAARYFPRSPLVHARLAEIELSDPLAHQEAARSAVTHARQAVHYSPHDYRNHLLLAAAHEANGETEAALTALQSAVRLAPQYAEAHWQLANLLLRSDQVDAALPEFHQTVLLDETKLAPTLDLIFHITDGDLKSLEAVAGDRVSSRLALAQFLQARSMPDEALGILAGVGRHELRAAPQAGQFITGLIDAGQISRARALWSRLVIESGSVPLLWNGGFEAEAVQGLGHFDWQLGESQYAWIGIAAGMGRDGGRALRLDFAGRDSTRLADEIRQMIVVEPGARYRLTFSVRTIGLITPGGPRVVVAGGNSEIASTDMLAEGERDWQAVSLEFTAPADIDTAWVTIRRAPRFSYDKPTSGTVLYDDFSLTLLNAQSESRISTRGRAE